MRNGGKRSCLASLFSTNKEFCWLLHNLKSLFLKSKSSEGRGINLTGGQGAEAPRPPYTLGVQQRRCFLLSPRDIGYLFSPCRIRPPTPAPPVLSISSVQSQSLYLRPWTQAGGELLVKQSLQRFQGREGPGDFAGGRGQGEGQGLVRTQ